MKAKHSSGHFAHFFSPLAKAAMAGGFVLLHMKHIYQCNVSHSHLAFLHISLMFSKGRDTPTEYGIEA